MSIRLEAYQTILKVFKDGEFSDTLLHQRAKRLRNTSENVALYYNLVKGVVKSRLNLDYILSQHTDPGKYKNTDLKVKVILYIGLYQLIHLDSIPEHAAVNETVELAKSTLSAPIGDFVNAVLRSWLRSPEVTYPADFVSRVAYEHSYPPELIQTWVSLWGEEDTEYLALYFNENPSLHMRVNATATTPEKLIQYFAKRDIRVDKLPSGQMMLATDQADEVLQDVAFSEGYFSIQDSSAALIVDLLDPQKHENILDLFAAPGGKCTYIAEIMDNTGEVVAVDKIPSKMKQLKQAADRLQLSNIRMVVADAFKYGPVAPAYDKVLVDAPCSGWGVFSRKADLRWQSHKNIPELVKLQEKALDYASSFVKVDGSLIYSTCTMNPQENEQQVMDFLKRNPRFTLVPADTIVPAEYTRDGMLKTIPFKHNMDGAFAARMKRIK